MIEPLGYHAMRMRWCASALRAFARRWAAYLVVGALAVGAGAAGGVDAVRALAAWSVLPLFRAAGAGWLVTIVALYAVGGALVVRSLRGLLWPARWLLAERALPIERRKTLQSDLTVVALALTPLFMFYAFGAETLVERDPAWLQAAQGRALVGLAAAVVLSVALGVAALQALRRSNSGAAKPGALPRRPAPALRPRLERQGWRHVLLFLPLWRGPARRTGQVLAAAFPILAAPAATMALRPALAAWCLAAHAVLAMMVTSRLRVRAADDFAALRAASLALPVAPGALRLGIDALVLSPTLLTAPLLLACLPWASVRPAVFGAFCASGIACCVAEARSTSMDPVAASSRWLLCAALLLALASEVVA